MRRIPETEPDSRDGAGSSAPRPGPKRLYPLSAVWPRLSQRQTRGNARTHARTHARRARASTRAREHAHTRAHARARTHTHTRTHAHTHTPGPLLHPAAAAAASRLHFGPAGAFRWRIPFYCVLLRLIASYCGQSTPPRPRRRVWLRPGGERNRISPACCAVLQLAACCIVFSGLAASHGSLAF